MQIGIHKISYNISYTDIDINFSDEFQLPVEVAIEEINWLKKILAHYNIDIDTIIKNENRREDDITAAIAYDTLLEQTAQILRDKLESEPFLQNAIANIFENTCICLQMINDTKKYNFLRKTSKDDIQIILDETDKIYEELSEYEYAAFTFLRQAARFRLGTAHEHESDLETETQLIHDIVALWILNDQYLKPILSIIFDNGYGTTLKTELTIEPTATQSGQFQEDLVTIGDLEVNLSYEYEDIDINIILDAYIRHNKTNLPELEVLGAVDNIYPEQLEDRLRHAQENYRGCILLIPYNLGNYHWVGLLVELDETGQPIRTICCDPLSTNRKQLKSINKYFKNVFPTSEINFVDCLLQTDTTSCGAVTINNLLMLVTNTNSIKSLLSRENIAQIRADHIKILKLHRPDYAEQFNTKQKDNQPTVASFTTQLIYQESLKNVKFSAKEAKIILKLASIIENLESPEIKKSLEQALSYNIAYKDNVKAHLDYLRNAINEALSIKKSEKDQHAIVELVHMFIGASEIILNKEEDWMFRLQYQMLLAIGNLVNKNDIVLNDLQADVEKQIAEDELLAQRLQLQEQELHEGEKSKKRIVKNSIVDTAPHKNRKGLSIDFLRVKKIIALPEDFILGAATDDGGCFFDALAQRLNLIEGLGGNNEKSLRTLCHLYYLENKNKVDEWNRNEYGGIDSGDEDYFFVQYTAEELKAFPSRAPVWGRPEVEGRILCEMLNIPAIYLIELNFNPLKKDEIIPSYIRITKDGTKQIDKIQTYNEDVPVLVTTENSKHFVPLLPKSAFKKDKNLSKNEVCGNKKSLKKGDLDKDNDEREFEARSSNYELHSTLGIETNKSHSQEQKSESSENSLKIKHGQAKIQQIIKDSKREQEIDTKLTAVTWNKTVGKAKTWHIKKAPEEKLIVNKQGKELEPTENKPEPDNSEKKQEHLYSHHEILHKSKKI